MQKAHAKDIKPAPFFPDKLFYKIGEISRIAEVEPYVLRYWESEFPFLKPRKSKTGQRVYVKKDLETILEIKKLLYEERYTIEGVRKRLGEGIRSSSQDLPSITPDPEPPRPQAATTGSPEKAIEQIKHRLRAILKQLT